MTRWLHGLLLLLLLAPTVVRGFGNSVIGVEVQEDGVPKGTGWTFDFRDFAITTVDGRILIELPPNVSVGACVGDVLGEVCGSADFGTAIVDLDSGGFICPLTASAAPTGSGRLNWRTDTKVLSVGDGTTAQVVGPVLIKSSTTDSTAITNTTTETAFSTGSFTIPTSVVAGTTYRILANGRFSSASASQGGLLFRLRWGPSNTDTLLFQSPNATMTASQSGRGWFLDLLLTVRTTGTSGTVVVGGGGSSTANGLLYYNEVTGAKTVDTQTAAVTVTLFALFSAANASNSVTLEQFAVYRENPSG